MMTTCANSSFFSFITHCTQPQKSKAHFSFFLFRKQQKRKKTVFKKMLHTFCCKGCIAHIEINIMHFLS